MLCEGLVQAVLDSPQNLSPVCLVANSFQMRLYLHLSRRKFSHSFISIDVNNSMLCTTSRVIVQVRVDCRVREISLTASTSLDSYQDVGKLVPSWSQVGPVLS